MIAYVDGWQLGGRVRGQVMQLWSEGEEDASVTEGGVGWTQKRRRETKEENIKGCDEEHDQKRADLTEKAVNAAPWSPPCWNISVELKGYFPQNDHLYSSSPAWICLTSDTMEHHTSLEFRIKT